MARLRNLIIVGIVFYLVFLVSMAPVSLIAKTAFKDGAVPGLTINSVQGSIWNGQGSLLYQNNSFNVEWTLSPWAVFLAKAAGETTITTNGAEVSGLFSVSPIGFSLETLNGYLDDQFVNRFTIPFRTTLTGRIWLDDLSASGSWSRLLNEIEGGARWTGGTVGYPMGNRTQKAVLPQMTASFKTEQNVPSVSVSDQTEKLLLTGSIAEDGWGALNIHRQLVELAGQPLPKGQRDVVFEIKEKVF